ncbi:Hypothetical predicted protein [Mytilus galloprovincialis]|uniref:Uncharacterized protein n=1 Tax=Mytilus galloprovincialis TaxID=29158 RepID=A0A8B6F3Y3_MYTGA|nr:Hypothetical predicted protein [Mytilus galloprovincialis]
MTVSREGILSYCAAAVGFRLISSAFNFYYVKVFLNIYHIEEYWFHVAQVSYLIWNAINDPLFAYIQDSTNWKFTKTRRESILYCGPLFALSFLVPWIPWGDSNTIIGLHLIASLFLWDTMFTFMGLAMCALFTELSQEPEDRIALTRYAQIASIIGSPSIMLLEFTSDNLHYFRAFQMTTVLIAFCSWLLFMYSGLHAHTKYDLKKMKREDADISHEKNMNESFWKQTCQILSDRNFIAFVITNFFHGLHKAFLSGFMVIVCDQLISDEVISASIRKTFYGAIGILSTVIVIMGAPLLRKYSYFKVIKCSYVYTVLAGLVMFCIGYDHPWCLMLFLLMDSCASGATFGLFNMPLADIADENKRKYMRKHPISSMVFGTNALITKPAFSLSPMFAVSILNSYGYNELKDKTNVATPELKQVMFTLICWYPIIVGIIQFTSWSFYRVRSNKDEINL